MRRLPLFFLMFLFIALPAVAQEPDGAWDDRFGWYGIEGTVLALDAGDCDLYASGRLTGFDGKNYVARYGRTGWSRLGFEGINGDVHALAVDGSELYIGGAFTQIGAADFGGIGRWTGNDWENIGDVSGGTATVYGIALFGGDLFVAGDFTAVDGVDARNLARFDAFSGTWTAIDAGVDGRVLDLLIEEQWLYVGGAFENAGNITARNIARFNLVNNTWQRLATGTNDTVRAIAVTDRTVYAGGDFTRAGTSDAGRLAAYDRATGTWSSLGEAADGVVADLLLRNGDLIVAGEFGSIGGIAAGGLARYDGTDWSALGGFDGPVRALADCSESLCVGGSFSTVDGTPAPGIAIYDDTDWSSLVPAANNGLNAPARAIALGGDDEAGDFYVAGAFTVAGSLPTAHIVYWTGTAWQRLGAGLDGPVDALALDDEIVVAGGSFGGAGSLEIKNVGIWSRQDGTWSPLGAGTDGPVHTLLLDGNDIYVGGSFTMAGGIPAANLARFDRSDNSWQALGAGTDGPVHALAIDGNNLWVGGSFASAGGSARMNLAQYDVAAGSWQGEVGNFNATVRALARDETGRIYVGGDFTAIDGGAIDHVALRDGTTWRELEGGLAAGIRTTTVYDIAVDGESTYFAGEFTLAGGAPIGYLARWRESWVPLGSGPGGILPSLHSVDAANGRVAIAGAFSSAGGTSSSNVGYWKPEITSVDPIRPIIGRSTATSITVTRLAGTDDMRLLLDSDFSVPVAGTIELIDLQGRRIAALRQEAIPSGRSTLSLGSLPTSHYLFRVILDR